MSAPSHRSSFDADGFLKYVAEHGGNVLAPTNEWEIARYRANWRGTATASVHIVYTKANGRLTYTGGSEGHYRAFMAGAVMDELPKEQPKKAKASPAKRRKTRAEERAALRVALLERDGPVCWFCGCFMASDDQTIEHLIAKSKRGPDVLENYALAHAKCNQDAGNVPLVEKIALRQKMRDARADLPPWDLAA